MWVQRSWPGLAGATGEQMRTAGAWFNLAKHYRMQCAPVPEKDELNFSHWASDSSFRGKTSNRAEKSFWHGICVSPLAELCCILCATDSVTDKHINTQNLCTHRALSPNCRPFYLPFFPTFFLPVWHTRNHKIHTDVLKEVCVCGCVLWWCKGVREKIPNLAWTSFLSRLCMRRPALTWPMLCVSMCVCYHCACVQVWAQTYISSVS